MRTIRPYLRAALVAIVVTIVPAVPAYAATSTIGPKQHYRGFVNNKRVDAVIYVVCPGPAGGDRTGPPSRNQTVKVVRVASHGGDTGSIAHQIWGEFVKNSRHVVGFTRFNAARPIPTSLRFPCSGKGEVRFTTCFRTVACAANARDDVVLVRFENIAV